MDLLHDYRFRAGIPKYQSDKLRAFINDMDQTNEHNLWGVWGSKAFKSLDKKDQNKLRGLIRNASGRYATYRDNLIFQADRFSSERPEYQSGLLKAILEQMNTVQEEASTQRGSTAVGS